MGGGGGFGSRLTRVCVGGGGRVCVRSLILVSTPQTAHGQNHIHTAPRSGLALKKHIDVGAGVIGASRHYSTDVGYCLQARLRASL